MKNINKSLILGTSILSLFLSSCSSLQNSNTKIIEPLFNSSINDESLIESVFDISLFDKEISIEELNNDYHKFIRDNNKDKEFDSEDDYTEFYFKDIKKIKSHYSFSSNQDETLKDVNYYIEYYYEFNEDIDNIEDSYYISETFEYKKDLYLESYIGIYSSSYIYYDEESKSFMEDYKFYYLTAKKDFLELTFHNEKNETSISSYDDLTYLVSNFINDYLKYYFSKRSLIFNFSLMLDWNTGEDDNYEIRYSPKDKLYLLHNKSDTDLYILFDNTYNIIGTYGNNVDPLITAENGENVFYKAFNVNLYDFNNKEDSIFESSLSFDINDEEASNKFLSVLLKDVPTRDW